MLPSGTTTFQGIIRRARGRQFASRDEQASKAGYAQLAEK
jgi:hypothetical protein